MKILTLFFGTLATAAFAAAGVVPENISAWQKPVLDVTFSYEHFGIQGPAGCSIRSLGGFDREAAMLKALPRTPVSAHLVVGTTFAPAPETVGNADVTDVRKASTETALALRKLRTFAVALGADDFWLGAESLEKLRQKHSLRFLASNLSSPSVKLNAQLTVKSPVGPVVFLSLVRAPDAAYGNVADLVWTSPAAALAREVAALPTNVAALVIATNLDVTERRKLLVDRNLAVAWVGGPEGDDPAGGWQLESQTVQGTVLDMGRMVGRRLLELQGPFAVLDLGQQNYWKSVAQETGSPDHALAQALSALTPVAARLSSFRRYALEEPRDFAKTSKPKKH